MSGKKLQEIPQLIKGICAEDPVAVHTMIKFNVPLNTTDHLCRTPLHWAVIKENREILRILLDNDALVDLMDHEGRTPLHMSALGNDPKIVEDLLAKGANPYAKDHFDETPVSLSVKNQKSSAEAIERMNEFIASKDQWTSEALKVLKKTLIGRFHNADEICYLLKTAKFQNTPGSSQSAKTKRTRAWTLDFDDIQGAKQDQSRAKILAPPPREDFVEINENDIETID